VAIKGYSYDPGGSPDWLVYCNDPATGTSKYSGWAQLNANSTWKASFSVYGIS